MELSNYGSGETLAPQERPFRIIFPISVGQGKIAELRYSTRSELRRVDVARMAESSI